MSDYIGNVQIITFIVKNLRNMRQFYADQLGLPVVDEKVDQFAMLKIGIFRLCIDIEDEKNTAHGGGAALIFAVPNIKSTAKYLKTRGIKYESRKNTHGTNLEIKDPEGYKLIFTEKT